MQKEQALNSSLKSNDPSISTPGSSKERRQHRRLPSANLNTVIKLRRGLINHQYTAQALDYSKFGLAVLLPKAIKITQSVSLKLKLEMDMGDIALDRVEGKVTSCLPSSDGYRIGIAFDYNASADMKSLETQSRLSRIEGILEKSLKLKTRIKSQL